MSRGIWTKIRQSNRFYVDTYRRSVVALIFSIALSVFLCAGIYYSYFGRAEPDFYATNGETAPIHLKALDRANDTTDPLLANDDAQIDNTKAVPN